MCRKKKYILHPQQAAAGPGKKYILYFLEWISPGPGAIAAVISHQAAKLMHL
jgi:hypothetical protein